MRVTLLGSGDALGVPAPLCDCTYCETSEERRRPSLLVETDAATVVLDVSPDLRQQLHTTGTTDVDAFFVTHHHFDHVGGVHELDHATMSFTDHVLNAQTFDSDERPDDTDTTLYVTPTAGLHFSYAYSHLSDRFDPELLDHGDPVPVGDLEVVPFPVDHARPLFDTVGFAVHHGDQKVVYAPDMRRFLPEWDAGREYEYADLLFAEGSALFRAETHGSSDNLRAALDNADAARTVLVNVNEHLQRTHTDALASRAADLGYELGRDFETYRP
jgi:phosphoribosyl 1,2-cyclic phosphate phosphodiesterase